MSDPRSVESTGPDIEEAIETGLKTLDVARENVIVEILDEPSRGLLGIGARMARVRLTTAVPPRSEREEFVPSAEVEVETNEPAAHQPPPQQDDDASLTTKQAQALRELVTEEEDAEITADIRLGAATLRELLQKMNVDADVNIERVEDDPSEEATPWILHVRGDELGLLIGHRGKTLAALQYITRLIASREMQERTDFVVDVENYKARREVLLKRLAQRLASDAVRRRRTIEMEPMPPYERRIIHMALRDHDEVSTESIGDGERRRVTIIPKR
ncbi:MAG: KH domain-containing protein [Chloroflexi bacterium]|nr:KH domain-containing protein [Chloroflexota bacterium]